VSTRILVSGYLLLLATVFGEEDKTKLSLDLGFVEADELDECTSVDHGHCSSILSKCGNRNKFQSQTAEYCAAERNCITASLRIAAFLDFTRRPVFKKLENTTFRKLDDSVLR
jgi:hypothetical protein